MKKRAMIFGGLVLAGSLAMGATALGAQITDSRAKDIALTHAGVVEEDVAYIFAKTDREHGKMVYEVEFLTDDYKEYDYEINAEDGTIISYDYDAEDSFYSYIPRDQRTIDISSEEAEDIALRHADKDQEDVLYVKTEFDMDDGLAVYEIEFYAQDGVEYDYEISAYTGEIISYDYDAEDSLRYGARNYRR